MEANRTWGTPRMKPVLQALEDLQKIYKSQKTFAAEEPELRTVFEQAIAHILPPGKENGKG